jgi:hypothetical protein
MPGKDSGIYAKKRVIQQWKWTITSDITRVTHRHNIKQRSQYFTETYQSDSTQVKLKNRQK